MARAQRLVGASTGAIVTCYSPVFAAAVADLEAEFKDTGEDNPHHLVDSEWLRDALHRVHHPDKEIVISRRVSGGPLGISVSTLLAASNCKVVIYASDSNGRPTTILRETGNIDCATTGTKLSTITALALTAGATYWIGVRSSGTQTLRTLAVGALPALSITSAATPVAQQVLIKTETYASAAANWTYASSQHSNALCPLVLMRIA